MTLLVYLQHQFYYDKPPACDPKDLPTFLPSHEMELKRIRHERDEAKKRQHPQQQQPSQQPDPKRQRHNPGQQVPYGGQGRGAGRAMPPAGGRAPYTVPAFDPSQRPGMAPPAAAAAAGSVPGRHPGLPGAVPRGAVPGGPMHPPYAQGQGPGRSVPVSAAGQGVNPAGGAVYGGAQGYANPGGYGGRDARGTGAYPHAYGGAYGGNAGPGSAGGGGYGAYGAAGAQNQLQGSSGRGAPRPNAAAYPPAIDRPAWNAQRR